MSPAHPTSIEVVGELTFEQLAAISKQELAEALRVAQFIGGVGTVYVAAQALDGIA